VAWNKHRTWRILIRNKFIDMGAAGKRQLYASEILTRQMAVAENKHVELKECSRDMEVAGKINVGHKGS
jgi:hypothetical protein